MEINLFSRLESYSFNEKTSKENLFTEIFAFVLENYPSIKQKFLKLVFKNKIALVNQFIKADILTQERLSSNIVADVLFKCKRKNLLIENKIQASEGYEKPWGEKGQFQIEKYLKSESTDYVAYITHLGQATPEYRHIPKYEKKFCGHFHWQQIYDIVQKYNKKKKSEILKILLEYMEENDMGKIEGYTKTELRESKSAFTFISKSKNLVELVKEKIEPIMIKMFGKNIGSKVISTDNDYEMVSWDYQSKKWRTSNLYFNIQVGINDNYNPVFSVQLGTDRKRLMSIVKRELIHKIKRLKWIHCDDNNNWWSVYKEFKLNQNPLEKIAETMIVESKKAIKELRSSRIINLINNRSKRIK